MKQNKHSGDGTHDFPDPVCGMHVKETETYYYSYYQRRFYYFCCSSCKAAFDKHPEDVLANSCADGYDNNKS